MLATLAAEDAIRALAMAAASTTFVLAIANLMVSFAVLRPKPFTLKAFLGSGAGFLWAHIVFVVIPFQGFVAWGAVEVLGRQNEPLTWRAPALLIFCAMQTIGYSIIFRVELARLHLKDSLQP